MSYVPFADSGSSTDSSDSEMEGDDVKRALAIILKVSPIDPSFKRELDLAPNCFDPGTWTSHVQGQVEEEEEEIQAQIEREKAKEKEEGLTRSEASSSLKLTQ